MGSWAVERTSGKAADHAVRQGWLRGKLRLKASCKLQRGLPQWEKLPVSQERVRWKVGLERSKPAACPLSDPSHTDSGPTQQRGLPRPGESLRPQPLTT